MTLVAIVVGLLELQQSRELSRAEIARTISDSILQRRYAGFGDEIAVTL